MKLAYVGIDLMFDALKCLYDKGHEILKIYTCKCDNKTEFNTDIINFAISNNIKYTLDRISSEDLIELKDAGCDLLICAAYYYKIPLASEYDEFFPMINIHPAPIPEYRGPWPMPIMLLNDEKFGAVTFLKLSEKMDEGDIIYEKKFEISSDENLKSYMVKSNKIICEVLPCIINDIDIYYKNARPQAKGRYVENPLPSQYTISYDMSIEDADRILRAFYGYECIYKDVCQDFVIINGKIYNENDGIANNSGSLLDLKDGKIYAPYIYEIN